MVGEATVAVWVGYGACEKLTNKNKENRVEHDYVDSPRVNRNCEAVVNELQVIEKRKDRQR